MLGGRSTHPDRPNDMIEKQTRRRRAPWVFVSWVCSGYLGMPNSWNKSSGLDSSSRPISATFFQNLLR